MNFFALSRPRHLSLAAVLWVALGACSGCTNQTLPPAETQPPPGGSGSAPTGLTATADSQQATLNWAAPAGATSYNVYQGTASGAESSAPVQTGIIGTSTSVTGLSNGTTYFFVVKALSNGATSAASNEASATPLPPSPAAPAAPANLTASAGVQQVMLNWSAASGATNYNVYQGTAAGAEAATPVQTGIAGTSATVSGLASGATYFFVVKALNGGGISARSNEASATPRAPPPPPPPPDPNGTPIAAWGDSFTSGVGADSGLSYPDQLRTLTGRTTFNGGVSGQTTDQIAARQGGAPALFTFVNNQIPASGEGRVQNTSTFPISDQGPAPFSGTIAGIHGLLSLHIDALNNWQLGFTRDAAGGATSVPAGSPFDPDTLGRRSDINVFWMGDNNAYDPARVESDTAACVAFVTSGKFVVLGMINAANEPRGSPAYDNKLRINADLARAYPANFIDIRTILVSRYDPSNPQDVQDHNNDVPPSSLRNDTVHLNNAGYGVVARQVADLIYAKGW